MIINKLIEGIARQINVMHLGLSKNRSLRRGYSVILRSISRISYQTNHLVSTINQIPKHSKYNNCLQLFNLSTRNELQINTLLYQPTLVVNLQNKSKPFSLFN